MTTAHPDSGTIRAALALAVRAPSIHNIQPWRWYAGETTVHLHLDDSRALPHTDPERRELLISCGAALHHFRVGASSLGWRTVVRRVPDPDQPRHLAAIEFEPATPSADAVALARAIVARRTDRRKPTSWEVPDGFVAEMVAAGCAEGATVTEIAGGSARTALIEAFRAAADAHRDDAGYHDELAHWSGRHADAEGVPARNAVVATDPLTRPFRDAAMPEAVLHDLDGDDTVLLVHTADDDEVSRLRAGEATSAVLLAATAHGLATCPLTEPLEVPGARALLRSELLSGSGFPQVIVRVGWASTSAAKVPATPRRALDEVLRPLA